jgi:hypothetical protein
MTWKQAPRQRAGSDPELNAARDDGGNGRPPENDAPAVALGGGGLARDFARTQGGRMDTLNGDRAHVSSPRVLFTPDPPPADLAPLLAQLLALLGDAEPLHVFIEQGGRRVELTTGQVKADPPKLNRADRIILEAVAGLPEAPTGQEIAKASGYPHDSHLKMKLSGLRKKGLLGGDRGDTGYPLTELAFELLPELAP